MEDGARQQNDPGDEPHEWPLTPGLIGKILGMELTALDAEVVRKIVRVLRNLGSIGYTGCFVLVFEDGRVQQDGYKINTVNIGPTAK